ncbi:MAG: gamma-glutamyl-phosphate reductase, partial [Candidatus Berkiella sp.]
MMMDFTFEKVKEASYALALIAHSAKQQLVLALSDKLITHAKTILEHNQLDLDAMLQTDPKYDRLMLTQDRITSIANSLKTIAQIDSPVGINVEEFTLSNGLHLQKKTAPLGVIGMIFEARPNVTLEAFVLCFMSSNACILKGGTDAKNTNIYLVSLIKETLKAQGMPQECVALMPHERDSVLTLLKATGMVDLIIPRGSQALIDYVKQNTA